MPSSPSENHLPRVLIVADNASLKFGGEATKPYLFFKFFRQRGMDVRLLVHGRCRDELLAAFPGDAERMTFIPDTLAHKALWQVGKRLPGKVDDQTTGFARHQLSQLLQRRIAQDLVRRHGIDVVHEPTPISPKYVSRMYGLGAPVVIGPMCGGMDYPPAFQYLQTSFARNLERAGRGVAQIFHTMSPGKLEAAALIVANDRTRAALPRGCKGRVYEMPESGVELKGYPPIDYAARPPVREGDPVRFVYLGRLVDWKAVDLLLEAFKGVAAAAYNPIAFSPTEIEPGLEETTYFDPPDFTFPYGVHLCEIEIDPETGKIDILALAAVDDFGNQMNPMIVAGQIHGGLAQGVGQGMFEQCAYDDATGQLLTGSLMDYALPRADDLPAMRIESLTTPCKNNPLGVKGCGEAGAIAGPAALVSAVLHALAPLGVTTIDMPVTSEKVWRACNGS